MGILLRMNRSIQAEGTFGIIKQDYGFRQFLLRVFFPTTLLFSSQLAL